MPGTLIEKFQSHRKYFGADQPGDGQILAILLSAEAIEKRLTKQLQHIGEQLERIADNSDEGEGYV